MDQPNLLNSKSETNCVNIIIIVVIIIVILWCTGVFKASKKDVENFLSCNMGLVGLSTSTPLLEEINEDEVISYTDCYDSGNTVMLSPSNGKSYCVPRDLSEIPMDNASVPINADQIENFVFQKNMIGGCEGTRYGCCPDRVTPSEDNEGSNCDDIEEDFKVKKKFSNGRGGVFDPRRRKFGRPFNPKIKKR